MAEVMGVPQERLLIEVVSGCQPIFYDNSFKIKKVEAENPEEDIEKVFYLRCSGEELDDFYSSASKWKWEGHKGI